MDVELGVALKMSPNGLNWVRTCFVATHLANCWCCINLTPVIQFGRSWDIVRLYPALMRTRISAMPLLAVLDPPPPLSTANKHLNEHTHLWFYQHQDVLQAQKLKKRLQGNSCLKSRPPLCSKLSLFALQPVHRRGGPATSIRLSNLPSPTHPWALRSPPCSFVLCVFVSVSVFLY